MRKRLVLAGGGHAHLFTLSRLAAFRAAGIAVSCVAPASYLSYSGMGPGMLSGRYAPAQLRFDLEELVKTTPDPLPPGQDSRQGETLSDGGAPVFIRSRVIDIAPEEKRVFLENGQTLPYDAISFGLGSTVPLPFPVTAAPGVGVYPVKPIEALLAARRDIESRVEAGQEIRVLVVGGGASGFEVAGNVLSLLSGCGVKKPLVSLVVGPGLLADWPARAARLAAASLTRRGARLLPGRVARFEGDRAVLADGGAETCDVLFVATGTRPPELFRRCGLSLSPNGGLTVNAFLQSPLFPEIFGGGDCIHFAPKPLPRAGVYAVRQGPVLGANLLAFLAEATLQPFRKTGTRYLAIANGGDGRAILRKGPLVFEGRWCLAVKDAIDRHFMRSFAPQPPTP